MFLVAQAAIAYLFRCMEYFQFLYVCRLFYITHHEPVPLNRTSSVVRFRGTGPRVVSSVTTHDTTTQ